MTTRWTFQDSHGAYPAAEFDPDHAPFRTTHQVDRARLWIAAQAARRAATHAGIADFALVAVRTDPSSFTVLTIPAARGREPEKPRP